MKCPHCGQTFGYDPEALLASGEPLATIPELAKLLGCGAKRLKPLLARKMYSEVRFLHQAEGPRLYCVADVRNAFEPLREGIMAARAKHEADERAAQAAKAAKGPKVAKPGPAPTKLPR